MRPPWCCNLMKNGGGGRRVARSTTTNMFKLFKLIYRVGLGNFTFTSNVIEMHKQRWFQGGR